MVGTKDNLKVNKDDEYQTATQAVVDDAMRLDVLGPNVQKVLREHKLCNDTIVEIICDAIKNDSGVQDELLKLNTKAKWLDRIMGALGGIVLTIVTVIILKFLHLGS